MCGGAIISDFIPQREAHRASTKRAAAALCATDFWPQEQQQPTDFDHHPCPFTPDQEEEAPTVAYVQQQQQQQQEAGLELWSFDNIHTAVPM
uniref:Uncharacterized protein n=1 Tax=Leersia perrieri TaxID=77586 RepID=A0A0D9X2W0_9ORYZ